jgi:membrane-bound metal-dependent hydrolase YbcI (DUF457 family)
MPYSHSLLGAGLCALALGAIYARSSGTRRVGIAIAVAVLSHYLLDAVTHRPDMPLLGFRLPGDVRLGTNLPLYPLAYFVLELACCLVAWRSFDARNRRLLGTLLVLMALWSNSLFGFAPLPAPPALVFGASMFLIFVLTVLVVFWAAQSKPRAAP